MDRKYTFMRDGVPEDVQPERWAWGVIYKNNTELHQFGDDGVFHQFREIKQEEVKLFCMYKLDDMSKRIDLVTTQDMQLFHFYCNVKDANDPTYHKRIYAFGYKKDGVDCYNFILPDDRVILSTEHNIDFTLFNI